MSKKTLMRARVFVVVTRDGAIGLGNFEYPVWHKTEKEDFLNILGLHPEYGEIPITGDEDARNVVGDFQHHEIVDKLIRGVFGEGRKRSLRQIAVAVRRSIHTVHTHLRKHHDKEVKRRGYCERWRRIKSPHDATITD